MEQDIQQNFYRHIWSNPNYKILSENDPEYSECNGDVCVKQSNGTWIFWNKHSPIKGEAGCYKYTNKGFKRQDGYTSNAIKRKVFLPSIEEISLVTNVNDQYQMDKFLHNSSGGGYICGSEIAFGTIVVLMYLVTIATGR